MSKPDQEFHIVVFPGATSHPRRFSVRRRTVKILLVGVLLASIVEALFLVQFMTRTGELWELETLRSEAVQHRQQATALSSSLEDLRKQLSNMREINTRIRMMLGLDPPKVPPSPLGLGGKEESNAVLQLGGMGGEREPLAHMAVQLQQKLTWLQDEAALQERYLKELTGIVSERRGQWAATPSIWPVRGWVSSGFGHRISPFTGRDTMHSGVDITAPLRTPVLAPAAGTIHFAGSEAGLGNTVTLSHGYGMKTVYGHMDKIKVQTGQTVKRGEVIGWVGTTGLSTGPHLHYEVEIKGSYVDPLKYIID